MKIFSESHSYIPLDMCSHVFNKKLKTIQNIALLIVKDKRKAGILKYKANEVSYLTCMAL